MAGAQRSIEEYRAASQIVVEGLNCPPPVQTLDDAPFGTNVVRALRSAGITEPTPIQAQVRHRFDQAKAQGVFFTALLHTR